MRGLTTRKATVPSSDAERRDQYADTISGDFPSDDGYADQPGDAFAGDYPFAGDSGHIDLDGSQVFGGPEHDQSEVRLSSGILGFLMELLTDESIGGRTLPPELLAALPKKPHKMHVDARGADLWSAKTDSTQTSPAAERIVWERETRRRVIVTNLGPGALFVSHDSGNLVNSAGTGATNGAVTIPAPAGGVVFSREFRTTGELWAASATGQVTVFDLQDEFDES